MGDHQRLWGARGTLWVAIVLGFSILTCRAAPAETTLQRILRTGEVRIGYAGEVPFGFRTPNGRVTGEAPEIARVMFARMGVPFITAVQTEFRALIRELRAGRFDVIAAGMTIVPERCREIAFSEPTYRTSVGFLVRAGNPRRVDGYEDIAHNPSLRLGVVAGTIELADALASGVDDEQLMIFPDALTAASAVKIGRVDAYAATLLTVRALAERDRRRLARAQPDRSPIDIGWNGRRYYGGFGFRKEDGDLRDAFNRQLAAFIGTPEHLTLIGRFGFGPENLPDRRTADLCQP
ncbi:ectoine/hydroxyectoine ABC transporter substrate-binding protein EhuB [Benzoatithermus flavus]|uniref:Ectoine/hydroxyectoine ABC transporter substrate-binding protein EhuB n=1 Tax=Benzoatithermus flavus TaxID=3108223 RepID=A0ABU8XQU1_9PROT